MSLRLLFITYSILFKKGIKPDWNSDSGNNHEPFIALIYDPSNSECCDKWKSGYYYLLNFFRDEFASFKLGPKQKNPKNNSNANLME